MTQTHSDGPNIPRNQPGPTSPLGSPTHLGALLLLFFRTSPCFFWFFSPKGNQKETKVGPHVCVFFPVFLFHQGHQKQTMFLVEATPCLLFSKGNHDGTPQNVWGPTLKRWAPRIPQRTEAHHGLQSLVDLRTMKFRSHPILTAFSGYGGRYQPLTKKGG